MQYNMVVYGSRETKQTDRSLIKELNARAKMATATRHHYKDIGQD